MFSFSKKSSDRLKGVNPILANLAREVIRISPVDFGISQGVRTVDEQRKLYNQGRSTPGKIVTNTMKSKHLIQKDGYGGAIDIACYINGEVTWSEKYYFEVADVFKRRADELGIDILWGGDFKGDFKDYPHFQIDDA